MAKRISYKRAFEIACDLLIGSNIAGIDADKLFELCMNDPKYGGVVSHYTYMDFILRGVKPKCFSFQDVSHIFLSSRLNGFLVNKYCKNLTL